MADRLSLIADPLLLPYVGGAFSAHLSDPAWLETPITVVSAEARPKLLCRDHYPGGEEPNWAAGPPGFYLGPAVGLLDGACVECEPWSRGVHLCVAASASTCGGPPLAEVLPRLRGTTRHRRYVVVIDLGGYLNRVLAGGWREVDYLVSHPDGPVRAGDLRALFCWLRDCHAGFRMYVHEGHHPGEPTWLSTVPPPFIGSDLAAQDKTSLFDAD